jgi:cell division cycle 14
LYYAALKIPPPSHNILASTPRPKDEPSSTPLKKKQIHFFNIDNELVYWNFFLDFGPLNLGQFARFCAKLHDKLRKFPVVCFYSATAPAKRANAVFLICAWQLLYLDRTPHEAYAGFDKELFETLHTTNATKKQASAVCSQPPVSLSLGSYTIASLPPFHDASPCACTYDLTVLDCLQGMVKARVHGFYNHETFDVDEYEHFEQVEVSCTSVWWVNSFCYF